MKQNIAIPLTAAVLCLAVAGGLSAQEPAASTPAPSANAQPPQDCSQIANLRQRQRCEWAQAPAAPMAKPMVMLCMRSGWDRWYSRWLWAWWSLITGAPYPHPPVWKWAQNTPENWNARLPDYLCANSPQPAEPTTDSTPEPAGGPVKLN